MQKICDIVLNFNNDAYEFYEWEKEDSLTHIKSINAFKVSDKCLYDFIYNDVCVNNDFLDLIKGKTQCYKEKLKIDYACVLYTDKKSCAFMFNKDGNVIKRSFLLFDEEDELIDSNCDVNKIDYKVLKSGYFNNLLTRKECNMYKNIYNYFNNILDKDEIKYLYFECFNKKEDNYDKAYNKLLKSLKEYDFSVIKKLDSIIKITKK